jgi:hypothetical protein
MIKFGYGCTGIRKLPSIRIVTLKHICEKNEEKNKFIGQGKGRACVNNGLGPWYSKTLMSKDKK